MQSTADALSAELESKNSTIDGLQSKKKGSLDEFRSQNALLAAEFAAIELFLNNARIRGWLS
jgi:hypothetical protein